MVYELFKSRIVNIILRYLLIEGTNFKIKNIGGPHDTIVISSKACSRRAI